MNIKVLGSSSKGNSYVIDCGRERLVLDCGVRLMEIMRAINWDVTSVKGCLVTHEHGDHCLSASELIRRGMDVYSCQSVADRVDGVRVLQPNKAVHLGKFKVVPFNLPHDGVENYGYVIWTSEGERILYATDYEYIPVSFKSLRPTHMLIECNYSSLEGLKDTAKYEHVARGHAGLQTTLDVIADSMTEDLEQVLLCHVSQTEDAEAMRQRIAELLQDDSKVSVAVKGLIAG